MAREFYSCMVDTGNDIDFISVPVSLWGQYKNKFPPGLKIPRKNDVLDFLENKSHHGKNPEMCDATDAKL